MGVNGEALQLHAIYNFYCKSCENFVSVQEVTLEFVSGTASHACCVWTCNEIESSYDKIIITIVPSYTRKNITRLLPLPLLLMLCTCNNTDGNKLVIFSGIASYILWWYLYSSLYQHLGPHPPTHCVKVIPLCGVWSSEAGGGRRWRGGFELLELSLLPLLLHVQSVGGLSILLLWLVCHPGGLCGGGEYVSMTV